VSLALSHPSLRAPLALAAEVVRHVPPADAAAFRMPPGFAVQLVALTPEARAAVAALADLCRPAPPAPPRPASPEGAEARLAALERLAGHGPYALLGVPPDAEFADVRRAAAALRDELEAVRTRPLAPAHPGRAAALLSRLDAAAAVVGVPSERLAHDARLGNWRGVQRCVKAGVPLALVAARREALLAANPRRAADAHRLLARARVARKLGNVSAAQADWEASLAADPLDLEALEGYVALRREAEGER
jgi:serine/threonine-protein kinase